MAQTAPEQTSVFAAIEDAIRIRTGERGNEAI